MKSISDKENQITPLSLDFNIKSRVKPKTQRNKSVSDQYKSGEFQQKMALIQKKKQYSQALRQKNQAKMRVNQSSSDCVKDMSFVMMHDLTQQCWSARPMTEDTTLVLGNINLNKNNRKDAARVRKVAMGVCANPSQQLKKIEQVPAKIQFAKNSHKSTQCQNVNKLKVIQLEGQKVGPFECIKEKQINQLKIQNQALSNNLQCIRTSNDLQKTQIQRLKQKNQQYQDKIQMLTFHNEHQRAQIQSLNIAASLSQKSPQQQIQGFTELDFMAIMLRQCQTQLFDTRNWNKNLQTQNFILKKRLFEQNASVKKQMAKEIAMWKERFTKAKYQNIMRKDSEIVLELSYQEDS